ncbi:MAG: hypothetical protein JO364_02135 [Pseudonocardiales bacterium]|nr:hypothetical protein [Pseudonocardiales bacterium]MBV9029113.1 hypothetical protein [Pseudonocardiales bacterium]
MTFTVVPQRAPVVKADAHLRCQPADILPTRQRQHASVPLPRRRATRRRIRPDTPKRAA